LDIDTDVLEWFDHTRLKLWVEVALDYQHKLTSGCYVLLRRPGIECAQFNEILRAFTTPAIHLRNNLKNDRQSVRAQIKGKKRKLEDNDDDIEIVSQR
ncbi:hypothetical protein B0H14DRAFT_2277576, partial [Mycena olivaceomarginata]